MRLELTRSCDHYPLKVACIPISPPAPRRNWLATMKCALRIWVAAIPPLKSKVTFDLVFMGNAILDCVFARSLLYFVPKTGLEPARLSTLAPETSASTNSAIWALRQRLLNRLPILFSIQRTFLENKSRNCVLLISIERQTRLELTRSCDHYPLKVACIPISPPAHCAQNRTRTCTSLNTRT